MTTRQLAEQNNVKPASLARKLTRWGEPYGLNDTLPDALIERILSDSRATTTKIKTTTRQVVTETIEEEETVKPEPEPLPIPIPVLPPIVETPTPIPIPEPPPIVKREIPALFKDRLTLYVAAFILISADAVSCGWIAWNEYQEFQAIAAVFFGLAGIAIGYSAIRMVISYDGWHGDSFAWGFGLFQVFLHLSAMQTFGNEWSYYIGKICISLALPLATAGIALAFKYVLK
jgi:hypothetical protein